MLTTIYSAKRRGDEGFTLIELLIVVIVIGLLAAIALPIFIDQQKVAVDASVASDVRNTVTNVTNAQAQQATTAKAAVSREGTKVNLIAIPRDTALGTTLLTRTAEKGATGYDNVPVLGSAYKVEGWNTGGKKYLGTDPNPAFTFDSTTGRFTQGNDASEEADPAADPDDNPTGPVGGGNPSPSTPATTAPPAPAFAITTTSVAATIVDGQYSATIATENGTATAFSATGLPAGLSISDAGKITGRPSAAGTFDVTVKAETATSSDTQDLTIKVNPNVLGNASFEAGSYPAPPASWGVTGGNVVFQGSTNCPQGDVAAHDGNNWLLFYSGDAGTNNVDLAQGVNFTINAGDTYTTGGWVSGCSAAGQAGRINLVTNNNGNFQTIASGNYTTTAAGWSYVSVSGVSPTDAQGAYLQFIPNTGQGNIAFDDFNMGSLS